MHFIIEPGGDSAPLAIGEANIDRREQPTSMLPHVCREAGSDALLGDELIGGANRCLVILLARLACQNRKYAAVDVDKRVGVTGSVDEPRIWEG
jgi:hypothetical protein